MAQQLGLDLPSRPALGRDAFLVAPSNAVAMSLIDGWASWPHGKLVLSGPNGSGKTHLAHVWADMTGARIIAAEDLDETQVAQLAQRAVAVEDVHLIAGNDAAERALFHLHNLVLAEGHHLLLTGVGEPRHWGLTLPDLASRMQGTTVANLSPPDDALLSAVLVKLLADRQLTPKPNLVPYLVGRIDRSFAAAIEIVELLDTASIAGKRPVTRALAAEVLDKASPPA